MTRDERDGERRPSGTRSSAASSRGGAPSGAGGDGRHVLAAWRREIGREPWWSRLFTASVRVPLPVAVGVLLLLIVTAALALRPARPAHRGHGRRRGTRPGGAAAGAPVVYADEPRRLPARDRGDRHGRHRRDGDAPMTPRAARHDWPVAPSCCARRPRRPRAAATASRSRRSRTGPRSASPCVRAGGTGPVRGDRGGRAAALELREPRAVGQRRAARTSATASRWSDKTGPQPFRVSFKALDRGAVERELKQRGGLPGLPAAGAARHRPALPAAAVDRPKATRSRSSSSRTPTPASASSTSSSVSAQP